MGRVAGTPGVAATPGPGRPVHPTHRETSTARHGPVGGRSSIWRVPVLELRHGVGRLGRSRRDDAGGAISPHPPQLGPIRVVVVIDEQRDGGVRRDVRQATQRGRPLRLVVDRAVDRVTVEREDDRHDVRPARPVGRRQPGYPGLGEPAARPRRRSGRRRPRRRCLVRTARRPGAQALPFGLPSLSHPRVAGRPGFQADLEPALTFGGPLSGGRQLLVVVEDPDGRRRSRWRRVDRTGSCGARPRPLMLLFRSASSAPSPRTWPTSCTSHSDP